MPVVSRTIEIDASAKDCYKVITDYDNYPKFLSDLKNVKIVEKKETAWKVEFTVSIIKEITYLLDMQGVPGKSMEWKLVKGFFKKNNGSWKLEEIGKKKTRATYTVDIEMGALVPKSVVAMLTEKNLPGMLGQFKTRIEGK
jgi:coenzyme Q-binding protein COQ10